LRTAHVARPDEKGKGRGEQAPVVGVDVAAKDLGDFAGKLDA
jgi:2-haloacid dehalogenase